ncbi:hypothetical protein IC229_18445 [Spirosoma sp. BT702]|uniref:Phage tail assembly chaperone n=1 Tax=Spirosoma profusum TaxID=2771354 RepID=A0A926Y2L8_9BACT|nr:hypothetical protein [Spirosoma profusum]MBD2702633.1 hypothetical protein [Spirosoma profusum]
MNKLSGYKEITLENGKTLEFKFANGALELYSELTGIKTFAEIDESLMPDLIDGVDENKNPIKVPTFTPRYLKAWRLWDYSAAKYAALAQRKPIDFTEWDAAEWIEQAGAEVFRAAMDIPEPDSTKKNEAPEVATANP